MPAFTYQAATTLGDTRRGMEEAESSIELQHTLRGRGLLPLDITPATKRARQRQTMRGMRADVTESVRYLAVLLAADFTLDRALTTAARVAARSDVADAILAVRRRVRSGMAFADALAEHPSVFPPIVVGLARAGERGGQLPAALARLAAAREREEALRAHVASALLYPAVMLVVSTIGLGILLTVVLPRMATLLGDMGAPLPASLAFLLGAMDFVRAWWLALVPLAAVGLTGLTVHLRSSTGRYQLAWLSMHLPIVGPIRQRLAAARFGQTMAPLLASGFPMLAALDIAATALSDPIASDRVRRAREEVRAGGRLGTAVTRANLFPPAFVQMVEVGDEAGRLPDLLTRAGDAMELELGRRLDRIVRLVEPALIVLFGGAVGFVALSLLRAIYSIRVAP
ncbi:MAG: type II secretion system F family protein [Gemmatimonadaceae bacterium]